MLCSPFCCNHNGVQMPTQASEISWRCLQALQGAGFNVANTSSFLPPFNFDSSWKRPVSIPLGRCEGAGGQCSREVSALFKHFLYVLVAEIWNPMCVWRLVVLCSLADIPHFFHCSHSSGFCLEKTRSRLLLLLAGRQSP